MKKINMSKVSDSTSFSAPKAEGYICGIYDIIEKEEYELFEVYVDIIEGDLKGYYKKSMDGGFRKTLAKLTIFHNDKGMSNFKAFLTSVEKSNNGVKFNMNAIDTSEVMKAKNKKIGLVFREREYEQNGEVKMTVEPLVPHSVESIKKGTFEIPKRKELKQSTTKDSFDTPPSDNNEEKDYFGSDESSTDEGFGGFGEDEELPFN